MPVINNLKDSSINEHPIRITKSEWLRRVATGEIDENNKMIYYITGDYSDSGALAYTIGDGLILDEDNDNTLSVNLDWLTNDFLPSIDIDATLFNGYGISEYGKEGVVVITTDYSDLDFGESITLNKKIDEDNVVSSTIAINDDGIIFGEALKANYAVHDDKNNEISKYFKSASIISNGCIRFEKGDGDHLDVPVLAADSNIKCIDGVSIRQGENGVIISSNIAVDSTLNKAITNNQLILGAKVVDGNGITTEKTSDGLKISGKISAGNGIEVSNENGAIKIASKLEAGTGIALDINPDTKKITIRNTGVTSSGQISTGVMDVADGTSAGGNGSIRVLDSSNTWKHVKVYGLTTSSIAAFKTVPGSYSQVAPLDNTQKIPTAYIPNIYASSTHTHNEYALKNHTHDEYASSTHTHNEYALKNHTHDYASSNHTHSYAGSTSAGGAANTAIMPESPETNIGTKFRLRGFAAGNKNPVISVTDSSSQIAVPAGCFYFKYE